MAWSLIREGFGAVREFFALEHAQRRSAQLTDSQRRSAGLHYEAATRRFVVGLELRQSATVAALVLLREAVWYYASSFLASIDARHERDDGVAPDGVGPEATLEQLDRLIEAGRVDPPAAFEAVKRVIASSDPFAFDRLAQPVDTNKLADDLEAVSRWLASLVEVRSLPELRRARVLRTVALSSALVALLGGIGAWVVAPEDLAYRKPVAATPAADDSRPEGAVDGEKNGKFGYHSQEDDSPHLVVDLERPTKIARVKIFGRGDCCYDQSVPLALEISEDGSNFRKIAERSAFFSELHPWEVTVAPLVARFVQLRALHHGVLVLGEVEVYDR
jgi:hypothetical protein